MKSKFTIKSYLVLFLSCGFTLLIIKVIPVFFNDPYYKDKLFPKIFLPTLLVFGFIYLVIGELRTKFIIVEIEINEIKTKRFLGLKTETYKFSEIEGWKYSHLTSRGGTYEYLYLYKDNKKIIKISEFYHKNYLQLKNKIQENFKSLGYEQFSLLDEFKEIFR
jgi:hypothetical protein